MKRRHKARFGAAVEQDGVRFILWAPRAGAIALRHEGNRPADLPMQTAAAGSFVLITGEARAGTRAFLQNHDQVGNHPFGTRLAARASEAALHAALAIVVLSPQIPMVFMGEEWASHRPFAFYCDFGPELAQSVREGRRREFADFPEFGDEAGRKQIPDPTAAATWENSMLDWEVSSQAEHAMWLARYRALIELRMREIAPRLADISGFAGTCRVLDPRAVAVEWRLGDGRGCRSPRISRRSRCRLLMRLRAGGYCTPQTSREGR